MLPLKVYLCNAWMKSHTPIHTKQNLSRNQALFTAVGVSLTDNHHYETKWWYNVLPHVAQGPSYTLPWYRTLLNLVYPLA